MAKYVLQKNTGIDSVDYRNGVIKTKNIFEKLKQNKKIFVETGTRGAEGVEWAVKYFDKVITVELDEHTFKTAQDAISRMEGREKVTLIQGDSVEELPRMLDGIDEPCFIYLDAHGDIDITGPNPLYLELETIKKHPIKTHTIVLDDVRRFGDPTDPCWGKIDIDVLKGKLHDINNDYEVLVFKDMLIAVLPEDLVSRATVV